MLMSSKRTQTSLWPLTAWNEVQAAGHAAGKEPTPLDELYRKYQTPLRVHLRQRFRTFPLILENAEDLLQDFATAKILKEGWLEKSDPRKGRFRDFLRASLDNLVWSWWKKQPEYKAWLDCYFLFGTVIVFSGLYVVNQQTVRKRLLPLRQQLETRAVLQQPGTAP